MDKWFGADAEEHTMLSLSQPEKQHRLFQSQKETLDLFLERGSISQRQYDQSLNDLCMKMGEPV